MTNYFGRKRPEYRVAGGQMLSTRADARMRGVGPPEAVPMPSQEANCIYAKQVPVVCHRGKGQGIGFAGSLVVGCEEKRARDGH